MKNTILFVDDELINLFVLEKRFESDYHVLTAQSGQEALQKINEHRDSLSAIISDLRMPEMSGLELIQKLKAEIDIPCFLLTGYDNHEQIKEAIESKMVYCQFKKPFDYNEIHTTLQDVI